MQFRYLLARFIRNRKRTRDASRENFQVRKQMDPYPDIIGIRILGHGKRIRVFSLRMRYKSSLTLLIPYLVLRPLLTVAGEVQQECPRL